MAKRTSNRRGEVVGMVRRLLPEEGDVAAELEQQINARKLVGQLAIIRNHHGITQAEVADQLDCSQSVVSKLENGIDEQVTIGQLKVYAKLADSDVCIVFCSKEDTLASQVKYHAMCIKDCFDEMHELVQEDVQISRGVAKFHLEALFNLVSIVGHANANLHHCNPSVEPRIQFRVQRLGDLNHPVPRLFDCASTKSHASP